MTHKHILQNSSSILHVSFYIKHTLKSVDDMHHSQIITGTVTISNS